MTNIDKKAKVSIDNVLFATDFSPAANIALSYAVAIAARYSSKAKKPWN
jgi:hypothetical protein